MNRVLTPARLLAMGIAFLALGLFVAQQSWDLDHGLARADTLNKVIGALDSVDQRGLELRLVGQPVPFAFRAATPR